MDPCMRILRHALGIGDDGCGASYRNHFVTGPGSKDYASCCALVDQGLMVRRDGSPLTGGDDLFIVTDRGRIAAKGSPQPLTRAQRRYRAFLDADSSMRFGDWLRANSRPGAKRQ